MKNSLTGRKKACIETAFSIMLFCSQQVASVNFLNAESDEEVLNRVLNQTGEYCEKLRNSILDFVCTEEIKERIDYSKDSSSEDYRLKVSRSIGGMVSETKRAMISSTVTHIYVYDYQLIKKTNQPYERRILLEEDGKSKREENAQLKLKTFWHKFVVLGPVGLLSKYWQAHHDYKIIGNKKYRGQQALVIEAIPKNPDETSRLYGKIWVDEADSSILKIEWDVKSVFSRPFATMI